MYVNVTDEAFQDNSNNLPFAFVKKCQFEMMALVLCLKKQKKNK